MIKEFIPQGLKLRIKKFLEIYQYIPDVIRYHKYANFGFNYDGEQEKLLAVIIKYYHIIEKGLSMPDTRFGFGIVVIDNIIDLCQRYIKKGYNQKSNEFIHAIEVLNEYVIFHQINKFSIDSRIFIRIKDLREQTKIQDSSCQNIVSNTKFFNNSESSFEMFAFSRHSCRNYTDKIIDKDIISHCVKIAQSSPSACNRQPNKVYSITNKEIIDKILAIQSGNRGFGHLSNNLLVLTSDIRVFARSQEIFGPHFNSGMFAMSLMYALHFYKIGSCALNWNTSNKNDKKLRKILNIPDFEYITLIISCGYPPTEFKYAMSPRKKTSEIIINI